MSSSEFEDQFFASAYETTLDAMAVGGPSETRELIPGRPETTVRLWRMPGGGGMKVGCLESIVEVLRDVQSSGSADGVSQRIQAVINEWESVWRSVRDQMPDGLSVGLDGQALELAGDFDPAAPGFVGLGGV